MRASSPLPRHSANSAVPSVVSLAESCSQSRCRDRAWPSRVRRRKVAHSRSASRLRAPAFARPHGRARKMCSKERGYRGTEFPARSLWRAATVTSTASITGFLSIGIATTVWRSSRVMLSPLAHASAVAAIWDRIAHDQFAPRSCDCASPRPAKLGYLPDAKCRVAHFAPQPSRIVPKDSPAKARRVRYA